MAPQFVIHADESFNEKTSNCKTSRSLDINSVPKCLTGYKIVPFFSLLISFFLSLSEGNMAPGAPRPAGSWRLCSEFWVHRWASSQLQCAWYNPRGRDREGSPYQLHHLSLLEEKWLRIEVVPHHHAPHLLSANSFIRWSPRGSAHRSVWCYTGRQRALFCAASFSLLKTSAILHMVKVCKSRVLSKIPFTIYYGAIWFLWLYSS